MAIVSTSPQSKEFRPITHQVSRLDTSSITSGRFLLEADHVPFALVGQGVAYYLSVGLSFTDPIHQFTPCKKDQKDDPTLENTFNHNTIYASGIFANQQEIDSKYVLVPFDFAQELFQMENRVSAIEVGLTKGASEDIVKDENSTIYWAISLQLKRSSNNTNLFYKVMQSEKWAIFFILAFILVIASFNILGSLSMLIIDKKADIAILQSMGANQKTRSHHFPFRGDG